MDGVRKSIMWFGNKDELLLIMDYQSKHLCHINILLLHALWQHPVKTIHEVRQHDINSGQPKVGAWAHSWASPELCKLKVFPFEVNLSRATTIHEPLLALLSLNELLRKCTETDVAFTLEYSRV